MPRVITSFFAVVAIALASALLIAPTAQSASADIVVSQLYTGGGNSGASFTNDFVELFNRGGTAVDVSGWTIQYASASGTNWSPTALSGSIAAGKYYLVQLASSAAVGSPLPTPDATGTTNLANSGGKVALVRTTTPLTCGASAGSCSASTQVVDLVGYGSAGDYEGSAPAPTLSNTTANIRAGNGCTDTDSNTADFSTATPAPRNSTTAAASCGSQPPPPSSDLSQDAAVDVDIQPVLSIALERSNVSFGNAVSGDTPTAVSEHVTVVSNDAAGYSLTAHRSAFVPADLPLGIEGTAPSGGAIGPALTGGVMAPIPIAPATDLLVGSTSARSSGSGDVWATSLGFVSPLPVVAPGHYTATVTFTVIGR